MRQPKALLLTLALLLTTLFPPTAMAHGWNALVGKTLVLYRFGALEDGWVPERNVFTNPAKEKPVEQFVLTDAHHMQWKYSGNGDFSRECSLTDSVLTLTEPLFGNTHLRIIYSDDEVIYTLGEDHLVRAFFIQPDSPTPAMLPASCFSREGTFCNGRLDDLLPQVRDVTYSSVTPMGRHFLGCHKATPQERQWLESTQEPIDLSHKGIPVQQVTCLFPSGTPALTDVNLKLMNDCNAESVLADMAFQYPDFIRSIIHQESPDSFRIDMFDPDGKPIQVCVSGRVPMMNGGVPVFSLGRDGQPHWTALLQKAIMKWVKVYRHITSIEGCNAEHITPLFTGDGRSFCIQPHRLSPSELSRMITTCLRHGMMVNGGFVEGGITLDAHETVSDHGHSFLPPQRKGAVYAVRNPWGKGRDCHVMNVMKGDTLVPPLIDIRVISPGAAAKYYRKDTFDRKVACRREPGLAGTYWRDSRTGDWVIGFASDKVIYGCQVWDISAQEERKDAYDISAKCGDRQISVRVGKEKAGRRTISVSGETWTCDLINSQFLPDHPHQDTTSTIADNGYAEGDSVTIAGWYRGVLPGTFSKKADFDAYYNKILYENEQGSGCTTILDKPDSTGMFSVRFPVENSTQVTFRQGDNFHCFTVEPGETYFLLNDLEESQTLVMGRNARLQNEELAHSLNSAFPECRNLPGYREENGSYDGIMRFLVSCDDADKSLERHLEQFLAAHPTISARYAMSMRSTWKSAIARNMMQARFSLPGFLLPDEYICYVRENYWDRLPEPYTLHAGDYDTFRRDYTQHMEDALTGKYGDFLVYGLERAERAGLARLSDADRQVVREYDDVSRRWREITRSTPDSIVAQVNALHMEATKNFQNILCREHVEEYVFERASRIGIELMSEAIEAEGWTQLQKDVWLSRRLCYEMDWKCKPLEDGLLDFADSYIQLAAAKNVVHRMDDRYRTLARKAVSAGSIKESGDLKDLSDGEQILAKILGPYKGKIVLLDIWGTWCGPCKAALAHSQEEYERLKDYPMVFLYLANNSSDESWHNVIKQYDVTGDNVVHYNLPAAQQKAVENFLGVHAFPSYFLFDQEGNLVDINVDARSLDNLEKVLERLIGK